MKKIVWFVFVLFLFSLTACKDDSLSSSGNTNQAKSFKDSKEQKKTAPLYAACLFQDTEEIKQILEEGAEMNQADPEGDTPLINAIRAGKIDTVKLLIENGADINKKNKNNLSPLFFAVRYRNTEIVKELLDNGADIRERFPIERRDEPLLFTVIGISGEMLQVFIDHGADINETNSRGNTIFDAAMGSYVEDSAITLIKNGITASNSYHSNEALMMRAVESNYLKVAKMLIEKGADINKKETTPMMCGGNIPKTPLALAISYAYNKRLDFVKLFVENGADLQQKTSEMYTPNIQYTPLMLAVRFNNKEIVDFLKKKGAVIDNNDPDVHALWDWFISFGEQDFIKLFIYAGADVNAKDKDGKTPLKRALSHRNFHIVELLRKAGAKE